MDTQLEKSQITTDFVSLQDLSKVFGLSYQALNYYSCLGLINPTKRQGNKRLYSTIEVKARLEKILKLKNEGYPLRVIGNLLNNNNTNEQEFTNELL